MCVVYIIGSPFCGKIAVRCGAGLVCVCVCVRCWDVHMLMGGMICVCLNTHMLAHLHTHMCVLADEARASTCLISLCKCARARAREVTADRRASLASTAADAAHDDTLAQRIGNGHPLYINLPREPFARPTHIRPLQQPPPNLLPPFSRSAVDCHGLTISAVPCGYRQRVCCGWYARTPAPARCDDDNSTHVHMRVSV